MNKSIILLIFLAVIKSHSEELPQANEAHSKGSLQDSISEIDVSIPYLSFNKKVMSGINFGEKVSSKINNALHGLKGYKSNRVAYTAKDVSIYILSMNIGDPKITDALLEAKKMGAKRVALIIDGDRGLFTYYKKSIKKKHITDWSQVKYRKSAMGKELKRLSDNGFSVNQADARYSVYFQPLSKSRHIRSLQHEKGLVLTFDVQEPAEKLNSTKNQIINFFRSFRNDVFNHPSQAGQSQVIESYRLTDNFTNRGADKDSEGNKRFLSVYNRGYNVIDRSISEFELQHMNDFIKTVSAGNGFDKMQYNTPHRVNYSDGSFIELAYTNGRFNLNSRMETLLNNSLISGSEGKLKRIVASHFVISNDEVTKNLIEYLNRQAELKDKKPTKLLLVSDDGFIDPYRVGLSSLFVGYSNKLSKIYNNGLSVEAQKNVNAYSFVRKMNNPLNINKPLTGKMLWHDKTTIFVFEKWAYIFTGSFNLSDRAANAEYQYMIKVPAESAIVKSFLSSITTPILERPHLFLNLKKAVFRTRLARFLGISVKDMDLLKVNSILKAIKNSDYRSVGDIALRVWVDKQASVNYPLKLKKQEVQRRTAMLQMFLSWYDRDVLKGSKKMINLQQVTMLSGVVEKQGVREANIEGFIKSLLHYSDISLEEIQLLEVIKGFKDKVSKFNISTCSGIFWK